MFCAENHWKSQPNPLGRKRAFLELLGALRAPPRAPMKPLGSPRNPERATGGSTDAHDLGAENLDR